MKARVVKGPVGLYAVEVRSFLFWKPLYNKSTGFTWRGSKEQANHIVKRINNQ